MPVYKVRSPDTQRRAEVTFTIKAIARKSKKGGKEMGEELRPSSTGERRAWGKSGVSCVNRAVKQRHLFAA